MVSAFHSSLTGLSLFLGERDFAILALPSRHRDGRAFSLTNPNAEYLS